MRRYFAGQGNRLRLRLYLFDVSIAVALVRLDNDAVV